MDQYQGLRLFALRERVARGEYQVDSRAVAEAIVRRLGEWALRPGPSEGVLVPRQTPRRVPKNDSRRTR
jgi:hypothetical protein